MVKGNGCKDRMFVLKDLLGGRNQLEIDIANMQCCLIYSLHTATVGFTTKITVDQLCIAIHYIADTIGQRRLANNFGSYNVYVQSPLLQSRVGLPLI